MGLFQEETMYIRNFISLINNEFIRGYGRDANSRFRREVKTDWLMQGMKQEILDELPEDLDAYNYTWPQICEIVQDAEFLANLHRQQDCFTREITPYNLRYHGFDIDDNYCVRVYTDGACFRNGQPDAAAGIGVWFGRNHRE